KNFEYHELRKRAVMINILKKNRFFRLQLVGTGPRKLRHVSVFRKSFIINKILETFLSCGEFVKKGVSTNLKRKNSKNYIKLRRKKVHLKGFKYILNNIVRFQFKHPFCIQRKTKRFSFINYKLRNYFGDMRKVCSVLFVK